MAFRSSLSELSEAQVVSPPASRVSKNFRNLQSEYRNRLPITGGSREGAAGAEVFPTAGARFSIARFNFAENNFWTKPSQKIRDQYVRIRSIRKHK